MQETTPYPLLDDCIAFLQHMFRPGNQVTIITKPHLDCVKAICAEFPDYDVANQVSPFVTDAVLLGKANHLRSRLALNVENDPVTIKRAEQLIGWQLDGNMRRLHSQFKDIPQIK
jgi:hypothetical protein